MTADAHPLDAAFLEQQRRALTSLRAQLLEATRAREAEEGAVRSSADRPREPEEDAQRLDALELDGNLVAHDLARLERVDRALKKLEEGTYGASDLSGRLIGRERLEAVPESLYTLAEEEAREGQ